MTLLLKNIRCAVSCDSADTVYKNTDIFCRNGIIEQIGSDLSVQADRELDCTHLICYPGLVNTHHHFYQIFSRNLPAVQGLQLFDWLTKLYEIWKNLDPELVALSTKTALAALVKSGCTTAFDHHYLYPKHLSSVDILGAQFAAADEIGARMYACRGSMNLSKKDGGLPPDSVVQSTDKILKDSMTAVERFHNPSTGSMHSVALAPCSPFTVSSDLYRESVKLARSLGVRLHTHLCETRDEENDTVARFGVRPLEYMEKFDFVGDDVWFAHGIWFNDEELEVLSRTGTGVAHCPASNMKLSSGVARIPEMQKLNIPVSIAVDGSASNDGSDMIQEMRLGYLLSRVRYGDDAPTAYDFLKMATVGGAKCLGRPDIGSLEVGKCADMFLVDSRRLDLVGASYAPESMLAAVGLSSCVDFTVINGKIVVENGHLTTVDEAELAAKANEKIEKYLSM